MRTVRDTPNTTCFRQVAIGDTFQFSGNDYIKCTLQDGKPSAVRLQDGRVGDFAGDTIVTPTPSSVFYRNAP